MKARLVPASELLQSYLDHLIAEVGQPTDQQLSPDGGG